MLSTGGMSDAETWNERGLLKVDLSIGREFRQYERMLKHLFTDKRCVCYYCTYYFRSFLLLLKVSSVNVVD